MQTSGLASLNRSCGGFLLAPASCSECAKRLLFFAGPCRTPGCMVAWLNRAVPILSNIEILTLGSFYIGNRSEIKE